MNGLIFTTIVMVIPIDLSLLKAVEVDGDTKEVRDIKDKNEDMDADTTMDVVDVDLGPGSGNYQGTSGNQCGSNYQGNNNGGQNNNKNNGNNGQHYNGGPPDNNGNNQYQGSNQDSNQGSNQGSINSSGNQGNSNQRSGGNDQHHFDMIVGNQVNNHGGNHNDRRVNPWERQDNDDISLYTNPEMNYYGTQNFRN